MALANLTAAQKARIRIVTIGDIGTPNGGLWPRLGFLGTIPIWNVMFGLPTPTDIGIVSGTMRSNMTVWGFAELLG